MPISLHNISIIPFLHALRTLDDFLKKGQEFAAQSGGKLTEEGLAESRLVTDMHPLTFQIQRVVAFSTGVAVNVAGAKPLASSNNETTFEELHSLIASAIKLLEGVDPTALDKKQAEGKPISWNARHFKDVDDFLVKFLIPSFYFHYVTAYALLRKEGVPVGKNDYLGKI